VFGFFKKNKDQIQPPAGGVAHPHHVGFAKVCILEDLRDERAGFIGVMGSPRVNEFLHKKWKEFGEAFGMVTDKLGVAGGRKSSEGLSGSVFTHEDRLIILITLPEVTAPNEDYFVMILLGPCEDPQWGPEARAKVPFRYFTLERDFTGTLIKEWTPEGFISHGAGPQPVAPDFVYAILNRFVSGGQVITTKRNDEAMVAAIARARSELPRALKRFQAGEVEFFQVKAPIKDRDDVEHMWLDEVVFQDGKVTGNLTGTPKLVSNVKEGQKLTIAAEDITDWMYLKNKKMYGNYTMRALFPQMPPDEVAKWRAVIADEPSDPS
jgi:uncharacterized protein YegJ (DUF2314 family)